ncbi:MAG: GNAT family N-acetyltransferase [Flavobacteriales bacterium]|nr:GNAT family N-acetyltransferase [Flavobacteriales bacterium]
MGWCGLKDHPDEGYVDLGFRLLREYRGNGYATEAGKACIEWAWKKGIPHLAGRVMESNVKSIRVLEKLGFRDWQPLEADEHCGLISILKNPRS